MLEPIQIMSGFKYIRTELHTKCQIEKHLHELALWFTLDNDILYVHDLEMHKSSMAIAVKIHIAYNSWKILLKKDSPGEILLKFAVQQEEEPHIYLNKEYKTLGNIPFRLLK